MLLGEINIRMAKYIDHIKNNNKNYNGENNGGEGERETITKALFNFKSKI